MSDPLSIPIFEDFVLANPFWVASADLSGSANALKGWRGLTPGALTLKTTAPAKRQEDTRSVNYDLGIYTHRDPFRKPRAFEPTTLYCDGPPAEEYLSIETTEELARLAREILPNTKLGISVLMGEDEQTILERLGAQIDFAELNLKYAARARRPGANSSWATAQTELVERVTESIQRFVMNVPPHLPVFIKMTREIAWLGVDCRETHELLDAIEQAAKRTRIGLILANTRRQLAPSDLLCDWRPRMEREELAGGIIAGEHLYIETFGLVKNIAGIIGDRHLNVPIVATGGITTLSALIEVLNAGASSVQMYTAFNAYSRNYLADLQADLLEAMRRVGFPTFRELVLQLRKDAALRRRIRELCYDIPLQNRANVLKPLAEPEREDHAVQMLESMIAGAMRATTRRVTRWPASDQAKGGSAPRETLPTAASMKVPVLGTRRLSLRRGGKSPIPLRVMSTRAMFETHLLLRTLCELRGWTLDELSRISLIVEGIEGQDWDIAPLSEPYALQVQTRKWRSGARPVLLGHLLDAQYAFASGPGELTEILHFGGPESLWILKKVEAENRFAGVTRTKIKTDAALTKIGHSVNHLALLAKDPLLTGYQLLSGMQLVVQKTIPMPVYLVASARFCQARGDELLEVYRALAEAKTALVRRLATPETRRALKQEMHQVWRQYFVT